ncbi:endoglucanase 4-like [Ptychodera flava]|uniref:endoglucanase 4-like n=1 Tax=Ptychodera flava TaxID=63121 RepID=UPI00396A12EE
MVGSRPGSRPGRSRVMDSLSEDEYDYNDVISKTILFFETQRSGRLPPDNRIPWRGDSALNDTGYNGEDLTGGWYDAGDHIKVTFKHTASVWKLALAFLEFGDAYRVAGQADYLYDTLIWGNNYTMKLHTKPNEFYVHVADPKLDHSYWGRPEDMTMDRPAYPSNETHPATEVAGNGVASLAASYLVFKDVNKPYADELLRHARELFNFADKFRGTCQENIPELEFKGGAYEDELTNAALWMYLATNETSYLDAAKEFYDGIKRKKTDALFTRNRLTIALQLMMYLTTKDEKYLKPFVDGLARWGPTDINFIALIAAKHGIQSEDNFNFARSQIHYILGDGGRSYLTGFGRYPPLRPHHRGA